MRAAGGFIIIVPLVILLLMVSAGAMLIVDSVTQHSRFGSQITTQQRLITHTEQQLDLAIAASPYALRQPQPPTTIGGHTTLLAGFSTSLNNAQVSYFELLTSDNMNKNIELRQQLIRFPLLQAIPEAALMLTQPLPGSVGFTVHFSEPISAGAPLTVWAGDDLTPGLHRHRCISSLFTETVCHPVLLTLEPEPGILGNSAQYPAQLLSALFGTSITRLSQLSDFAQYRSNCESLDTASRGLIIVTGPCVVAAGQQIGSSTAPVLLMVTGNQLHLAIYGQLNGLVLMPGGDPSSTVDISISPEAVIAGALMVEGALAPTSRLTVRYDSAVLRNLQKLSELQRVQAVIGSWRDF